LAALLGLVGVYTALVLTQWSHTPLGQHPEGEAAAWLADAESLYRGTAPREPFFRAPAYLAALVLMREVGVPASGMADAARALNGCAHLLATALLVGIGLRFWRVRGALFAGALWGFYPPTVFMAAQPGPDSLALLVWLGGVVAALDIVWQSPIWRGGRLGIRHAWLCPFIAGVAFVLAAALSATFWPTALAWPAVAIFLGRDARGCRMLAAALGAGLMIGGLMMLQSVWSGSPQPLAGADLYRLDQALEITQPWAAPLPALEFPDGPAASDELEKEAVVTYQIQTGKPPSGLAVLDGYWWRGAAAAATNFPAHSLLRAARKAFQFFAAEEFSAGPDYARARADAWPLRFNPLGWTVLLVLGIGGWVLGRHVPATGLALVLLVLAGVGGVVWYPTLEARAPVAALLALLAGAMLARSWPMRRAPKIGLCAGMAAAAVFTWLPRPHDPSGLLAARDSRERAAAAASLGDFDNALRELARAEGAAPLSPLGLDLAASWRFAQILKKLPVLPTAAELERQMLDNADITANSPAAQFRCGACLWLLGRTDGAVYYWDNLSNNNDSWGAAARAALAESGYETPAQARRRSAWEMGGGPQPDPALAPFFARLRVARASATPAQN
jgi:hypothetical protein